MPSKEFHKKTRTNQGLLLRQIKALIIDLFMIYTPILYGMTYLILGSKEALWHSQGAIFLCVLLYAIIDSAFCSIAKQTPGMRAQDLVLLDLRGEKLSFLKAFLRFFLWLISLALVFGFIFPFLRRDKRSFQDVLCHSCILSNHKEIQ